MTTHNEAPKANKARLDNRWGCFVVHAFRSFKPTLLSRRSPLPQRCQRLNVRPISHDMPNRSIAITALYLSISAMRTEAATLIHGFRGVASGSYVGGYFGAQSGGEISITVSYDDTAMDLDPSSSVGRYEPSSFRLAASLLGGTNIFETTIGSITVDTTAGAFPALHIIATLPDGDAVFFLFRDDDRSFVTSTALPIAVGNRSDWDRIDLSVLDLPAMLPETRNPLDVDITSIVVPEPTTASSLVCGLLALGLLRRRR